jgi:hypothetical protein
MSSTRLPVKADLVDIRDIRATAPIIGIDRDNASVGVPVASALASPTCQRGDGTTPGRDGVVGGHGVGESEHGEGKCWELHF